MHALIGDIGNTTTKICLIEINTFKIKKMGYFKSKNIQKEVLPLYKGSKDRGLPHQDPHTVAGGALPE
mgnify:CR=1 FL=1